MAMFFDGLDTAFKLLKWLAIACVGLLALVIYLLVTR